MARPSAAIKSATPMSTGLRVTLTLLYIPGSLAIFIFWRLIHPALVQEVAAIDIGYPKLTAAFFGLLFTLAYPLILLPYYLIWRGRK